MDYLKTLPSHEFASKLIKLTWHDVWGAVSRKIVSRQFAVEHALSEWERLDEYPDVLVDLASLGKGGDIHPYIDELVAMEQGQPENEGNEKLLYLVLSWLYETRDSYSDSLEIVEQVYADFDYPEKIEGFVRYMPSDEPDLGSVEKNRARLFEKWAHYLSEQKIKH